MNKIVGFGFAAAVAVVVLVIGAQLFGSPSNVGSGAEPTIEANPETSRGFSTFTSTMHGISIDYPSGWQIRSATEPWTGGPLNFDSPAADVIFDPELGDDLYIVLASQSGRPNQFDDQSDQFDLLRESGLCDAEGGGGGGTPAVDGASTWHWHCDSAHTAAVTTPNRRYLIALVQSADVTGLLDAYDFDAALETVDLRPDEAR